MSLTPLLSMFGRSPIRPLEQHMHKVHTAVKLLASFFEATEANDWGLAQSLQQDIAGLEREADDLKRDIRLHLPKGLFLPVSRNDVLALVTLQDRLANKAKDIAGLVLGRHMQLPKTISALYQELLARCIAASKQACQAINELDQLLESGFKGNEVDIVENMIIELNHVEHETDRLQVNIRQICYKMEHQHPPIDMMFLYKLIDWTGELADRAQTVGGHLQILIAR